MACETFTQDPDEVRKVPATFASFLAAQGSLTITNAVYIVPSALTATSTTFTDTTTSALITIVVATEEVHQCVVRVTLSDTQIVELPFKIRIRSNKEG